MDKKLYDRREVADDEKQRMLDLSRMNLVPPSVGICDPPLRVYPLNNEWAKIVIGFVSWLATIAPWRDAEDESYVGIQEVLTFMIGCDPCEALAGCFEIIIDTPYDELPEGLRRLRDSVREVGKSEGTPSTPSVYNENPILLDLGEGCDYDNLYAAITQFIDYVHMQNLRFLRSIEAATSNTEMIAEVISAIPVIGWLPFDEALELADTFLENMRDNYLGNYTQLLRDEYACELFCLFKDDCQVNFFRTAAHFTTRAAISIATLDFQDAIELLTQGVFSGEEVCDAMFAFFFIILAFGGSYAGETPEHLALVFEAYSNDSNPDWSILCGCGYEYTYPFDQTDMDFWNPVLGFWATSIALYSTGIPTLGLTVDATFGTPFDGLEKVAVYTRWSSTGSPQVQLTVTHSGGQDILTKSVANLSWREFTLPDTRNGVSYIEFTTGTAVGVSVAYDKFRLSGIGDNPPPAPDPPEEE